MRCKYMLVLQLVAGMLVLSGCNLPTPVMICPVADLVAASLSSPANQAVLTSTSPYLIWSYKGVTYPYPKPEPTPSPESACRPNKYRVSLSTAPLFTDELGAIVTSQTALGLWKTPVLQSGQTYRWSVVPISHGVEGPASQTRYFSIGNPCSLAELKAPDPVAPPNGSTVDTLTPKVMYKAKATCQPDGYVVQYSQDSGFGSSGTYGGPGYYGYGMTLPTLQDCKTYYWHVAAWLGNYATTGPYSPTWSFKVSTTGLCQAPLHLPEEFATLPPGPDLGIWEVTMNANCRAGPGTVYNESGFAPAGFKAKIQGRNEDGSWFRLLDPSGTACWVSKIALTVPNDWSTQPVLTYPAPPPPTKTPPPPKLRPPGVDCSKIQSVAECLAQPSCFFDRVHSVCTTR